MITPMNSLPWGTVARWGWWTFLTVGFLGIEFNAMAGQTIRIAGSTTILPIASQAAERFMRLHPEAMITVSAGGSGVGFHSVATHQSDIGMMSRDLTAKEYARFPKIHFQVTVIGRDAVACVVSSEVYHEGVHALSRNEIRDIYLGKVRNWKLLGGPDRLIVVIDKERHRGTRHVFMEYIMGNPKARAPGARLVTGSNNEEQTKIAQSDSAIGMLSQAWINSEVRGIALREGENIIDPSLDNIRKDRFPISRNLGMVTRGEPIGIVKKFLDFILSPEMQDVLVQEGYVSILPVH